MSLAERYDEFYSAPKKQPFADLTLDKWPRDRTQAILADVIAGGTVLDMGCGDGLLLFLLRKHFSKLVGLEYSSTRLDRAIANLQGLPFEGVCGSAEDMSEIQDSSIDCIVSADTIEHVPDVYAAARELFRVLKPGGSLVINTPNIAFIKKRLLLLLGRFPSTSQPNEGFGSDVLFDGGHLHYFTFRSLRLLLEKSGFEIVRMRGYGRFGRFHDTYPPLFSGGVQWMARKPG